MTKNLCIDVGNTRIKLAIFENNQLIQFGSFNHFQQDEIVDWIANNPFEKGIYSSVLKTHPDWLNQILEEPGISAFNDKLKSPLIIQYKSPESLGRDRIAAMVGAIMKFPENPVLVINAGTCITYDLVNKTWQFVGGNIAPGLEMRWQAMHEYTSALPRVYEADQGTGFLGFDTKTALFNGGFQGIILEIEGYYRQLSMEYSGLKCIVTGGTAPFLVNHLKIDNFAEPYLVLKGLNTILNYQ
jgi:type III pantothenate kinase